MLVDRKSFLTDLGMNASEDRLQGSEFSEDFLSRFSKHKTYRIVILHNCTLPDSFSIDLKSEFFPLLAFFTVLGTGLPLHLSAM